jgi:excisionase family DNA binding protein
MRNIAAPEETLLTAAEFAKRMNIKEATVRSWLLRGKLSKVKVGARLVRIPSTEIGRIMCDGFVPARKERP